MRVYDEDGLCVCVCEPKNPDIEEYMEKLLIRGRKEITITRYRYVLQFFCRTLKEIGRTADPRLIQEDDVYRALGTMKISLSSQESYAFIIKQWCRYWKNYDPNTVHILTNSETPTAKWITYDDLVKSMRAASTKAEVLFLYLGGNYGLRRGEMAKLKVTDIKRGYMVIHGKGHGSEGKVRYVPLVGDEDPIITEYLKHRENLVSFCNEDRTEGSLLVFRMKRVAKSYTPENIGRRCKDIMNKAGVDGTTHSLRREFITTAYRANGQLLDIMRIVGHTDPKQTVKYIENDLEYMRETISLRKLYISNEVIT